MPSPLPPPPGGPLPPEKNGRDARGRFAGAPGPGRVKGSRNKVTLAVEALLDGEAEEITRAAIKLAKEGDPTALRLVIERLAPIRRGRAVEISGFPKVEGIEDVPAAHSALISAVAAGEVTPDEARPLSDLLTAFSGALDAAALQIQLDELKRRLDDAEHGAQ